MNHGRPNDDYQPGAPSEPEPTLNEHRAKPRFSASDQSGIPPLEAIRILRVAGGALLTQAGLLGQLAWLEWAQERNRLLRMVFVILLGFSCLLGLMLSLTGLALMVSWKTSAFVPTVILLIIGYSLGLGIAWRHFHALAQMAEHSFSGTREELAADMKLLKPPA